MSYNLNAKINVLEHKNEVVTSNFGYREISISKGNHNGIDIVSLNLKEDGILAFEDGIVIKIRNSINGYSETYTAGNYIYIDHGNGYITKYFHIKKNSIKVKVGDYVKKGTVIGITGNTGLTTGVHLHFEIIINNKPVDPKDYLLGKKQMDINKYTTGRYVILDGLNVRKGPGINYKKLKYNEFTKDAQNQILNLTNKKTDYLVKDVIVDVLEVKNNWGRIPSGWIGLKYTSKIK